MTAAVLCRVKLQSYGHVTRQTAIWHRGSVTTARHTKCEGHRCRPELPGLLHACLLSPQSLAYRRPASPMPSAPPQATSASAMSSSHGSGGPPKCETAKWTNPLRSPWQRPGLPLKMEPNTLSVHAVSGRPCKILRSSLRDLQRRRWAPGHGRIFHLFHVLESLA